MQMVLISHGELAQSMLGSAQMIVGEQEKFKAFGLFPKDDIGQLKEELIETFNKFQADEEILCFTDLFSGSPFNAVVSLMGDYPIHHITGMNLPIILESLMLRSSLSDAQSIADKLLNQAPTTIVDVNQYLNKELTE